MVQAGSILQMVQAEKVIAATAFASAGFKAIPLLAPSRRQRVRYLPQSDGVGR